MVIEYYDEAIVQYFIDQPYLQEHQLSVRFDDEKLDINWDDNKFILSEKIKWDWIRCFLR